MRRKLALLSLSRLERGRVEEAPEDWSELARFRDLETLVAQSLNAQLSVTPSASTPASSEASRPSPLKASLSRKRAGFDEALLQKLVQYRNQIPPSSRIIRASET